MSEQLANIITPVVGFVILAGLGWVVRQIRQLYSEAKANNAESQSKLDKAAQQSEEAVKGVARLEEKLQTVSESMGAHQGSDDSQFKAHETRIAAVEASTSTMMALVTAFLTKEKHES